jgi:hypothetical protein
MKAQTTMVSLSVWDRFPMKSGDIGLEIEHPALLQIDLDPATPRAHGGSISNAVLSGRHKGDDGRTYELGNRLTLIKPRSTVAWVGLADVNHLLAECIGALADEDLFLIPAPVGHYYCVRVRDDLVSIYVVDDDPLPGVEAAGDNVWQILSERHVGYSYC